MSRSRKIRIIRSRCRWVFFASSLPLLAGLGGEPHLVVLDVTTLDVGDDRDVGRGGDPAGQLAQRGVGDLDAARGEERGELQQVAAHGGDQLWRSGR
jgi:hypothetical protein